MMKKRFYLFFLANRKRRFKFQKQRFLKKYLSYFIDLNFMIHEEDQTIFIGNRFNPKLVYVCQYNTNRQILDRKHRYYPLKNNDNHRSNLDRLIRITIILLLILIYTILSKILNQLYLSLIFILLMLIVIIGKSNYHNFSSTGSLFLLQELALCVNVNDVLFVIYDDHKNQYLNLKSKTYHRIVFLDRLVFGSHLMLATRNIQLANINTKDLKDHLSIFAAELGNDEFKQFNPQCKLLILSLGFEEKDEFYCKYVDTSDDVTLDLVIYDKILNFLKQLVQ